MKKDMMEEFRRIWWALECRKKKKEKMKAYCRYAHQTDIGMETNTKK